MVFEFWTFKLYYFIYWKKIKKCCCIRSFLMRYTLVNIDNLHLHKKKLNLTTGLGEGSWTVCLFLTRILLCLFTHASHKTRYSYAIFKSASLGCFNVQICYNYQFENNRKTHTPWHIYTILLTRVYFLQTNRLVSRRLCNRRLINNHQIMICTWNYL